MTLPRLQSTLNAWLSPASVLIWLLHMQDSKEKICLSGPKACLGALAARRVLEIEFLAFRPCVLGGHHSVYGMNEQVQSLCQTATENPRWSWSYSLIPRKKGGKLCSLEGKVVWGWKEPMQVWGAPVLMWTWRGAQKSSFLFCNICFSPSLPYYLICGGDFWSVYHGWKRWI